MNSGARAFGILAAVYEFLAGGDEVGYESVIRFTNDAGESYDVTVKVKRGTP